MAIITAISLTVLVAFAGLGVDVALWMRAKNNAQGAADSAANSVAAAAAASNPSSRLTAEADAAAAGYGFQNGMHGVTVTVHNPPSSGSYAGNADAYEVIISKPQKVYLSSVLSGVTAPTVRGRAVALVNKNSIGPTCILGLSPLASNVDVTFNGNASVVANNCDVDADSPSSNSINTNGGGTVHAANVRTVGGTSNGNIYVTGHVTGGGPLKISAQTSGPTGGIALWADKHLPNKEDKFAGGTTGNLVGAIYLPSHDVKYAGNSNTTTKCM